MKRCLTYISYQGNTNQAYNEIPLQSHQDSYCEKIITSAGEDVEKLEPSCTVGGNVNWYSHYGEQHGGSLKI